MFSPPSSSTSNRRSSISSVTSSGRRRDHSILDLAASLGQRTPERSLPSDDAVSTRSRQLDFGNDGKDEEDQHDLQVQMKEEKDLTQDEQGTVQDGQDQVQDEDRAAVPADSEVEAAVVEQTPRSQEKKVRRENYNEVQAAPLPGRMRGRRGTVFWSEEEEDFLRRGVAKHGVGKWKKILIDGQDVFKEHRTNVDLKDKWKNLQRSGRKRTRRSGSETSREELVEPEEQPAVQQSWDSPAPARKTRRLAAVKADRASARIAEKDDAVDSVTGEVDEEYHVEDDDASSEEIATSNGPADEPSGLVKLKFATDKSFPELADIEVDVSTCQDVAALKTHLRSSLLSDVSPPADIQVIGLQSRLLFEDEEPLARCVRNNGPEFFLVLEESPEEFV